MLEGIIFVTVFIIGFVMGLMAFIILQKYGNKYVAINNPESNTKDIVNEWLNGANGGE